MARRIECKKCGTLNAAGDVCRHSEPRRELWADTLQKENMELKRNLQEFQETHNTIAMAIIRPVEDQNARLRKSLETIIGYARIYIEGVDAIRGVDGAREDIAEAKDILSNV